MNIPINAFHSMQHSPSLVLVRKDCSQFCRQEPRFEQNEEAVDYHQCYSLEQIGDIFCNGAKDRSQIKGSQNCGQFGRFLYPERREKLGLKLLEMRLVARRDRSNVDGIVCNDGY